MTKETFEYEIETCDICKAKRKKNPKIKQPGLIYNTYTSNCSTSDWTAVCASDIAETVPEHIDMCELCTNSFNKWRTTRESYSKCECGHND